MSEVKEEIIEKEAITTDDGAGQTPEKSPEVQKPFSEMTDEERLELPEEELLRLLEEEDADEKPEEKKPDEEDEPADKSIEEKLTQGEELTHEELEKATPDQRGRYYSFEKIREKNRRLEAELERERAVKEGQLKVIEQLNRKAPEQGQPQSEVEKFWASINQKASQYQEDTGDDYRLTLAELQALELAKQADYQTLVQQERQEAAQQETARKVQEGQRNINASIEAIKKNGVSDFDHVWERIVQPLVNPNLVATEAEKAVAIRNAKRLWEMAQNGEDVADYVYNYLARTSQAGKEYFSKREQREINQRQIESLGKQTTTTGSQSSGKTTAGRKTVTMQDVDENFEYWHSKLTEEQFLKVCSGEEVLV